MKDFITKKEKTKNKGLINMNRKMGSDYQPKNRR